VGVTFAFLKVSIITPALIIGCITFGISLGGVYLGNKAGDKLGPTMEVAGGIILMGMGVKILVQHLFF
jgi:putative Mn2+ efflux pump MntP